MLHSKAKWKPLDIDPSIEFRKDIPLDISPVVEKLLLQRGIHSASEAERFLFPSLEHLHDPGKLADIEKASERVKEAIDNGEKILIYGDYDADGVTATTVMMKALEELGANVAYYIPNRFKEGYGPNEKAFREAYHNGFTVIITVDNGIAAIGEADIAKALGIDLIITDHHEVQGELPDAFAIIHPVLSPEYPYKELAGVGVAFKFAQYLLGYFPKHLLEYTAIGTIADLVPLTGENRVLAYFGLKALTRSTSPGIYALKQICRIEGNVKEDDVGFRIGPRLNAVGRLQDAGLAVNILLTETTEEAIEMADEIEQLNQQRQRIVDEITEEAIQMVDSEQLGVLIVYNENWNEGVLGIVASNLVKKFDRPAIVLKLNRETGELKGSARSIPAFDLFENCMKVRHLFTKFGGHSQAAGMTIPLEHIEELQKKLDRFITEQLTEDDFKQEISVSGELKISDITERLIEDIERLAPFGIGNPKPIFKINHIPTEKRQIGSKRNHLKLQFHRDGNTLDGVGFSMGDLYHHISPNTPLQAVGELNMNEWNGHRKPQLLIRDMKIDEWQLFDYRGRRNIDFSFLEGKNVVMVSENPITTYTFPRIDYESVIIAEADHLILFDLPDHLDQLGNIVKKVKPTNIYAAFQLNQSTYLKTFPKREDFVWLYALIHKRKSLNIKENIDWIIRTKSWSKENILFMLEVFSDLEFITVNEEVAFLNPNPVKKELESSTVYQKRLRQLEIEQTLYYSNYEQCKNWFKPYLDDLKRPKEETINGL